MRKSVSYLALPALFAAGIALGTATPATAAPLATPATAAHLHTGAAADLATRAAANLHAPAPATREPEGYCVGDQYIPFEPESTQTTPVPRASHRMRPAAGMRHAESSLCNEGMLI